MNFQLFEKFYTRLEEINIISELKAALRDQCSMKTDPPELHINNQVHRNHLRSIDYPTNRSEHFKLNIDFLSF